MHFLDQAKIYVKSGGGGPGAVSFRREMYVEYGGPDGGNGGRGGDIVFEAVAGLNTLIDFRYSQHFKAPRGQHGMGKDRTGASAKPLVIKVPVGTQILSEDKEEVLADFTGLNIITSDKGKSAKIWDVRAGSVSHEFKPHAGGKPFKCLFLGGTGTLVTAGFTAQAKREFKLWSLAAGFEKPLTTIDLDQQSGALMPFYDEDTRMLYLTGKGDGNIRYYELSDEAPYVFPLTEYRSNVSTKGADMLPKRGLKVMGCEVAHMLKLTSNCVEPLSFIVPRKETTFQEDIFPDT
jgi:hypothetical protein